MSIFLILFVLFVYGNCQSCPMGTSIGTLTTNNDVVGPGFLGRITVSNIEECGNTCLNHHYCNSYNYFSDLNGCEVMHETSPDNSWTQDGPLLFCALPKCPHGTQIGTLRTNNDIGGPGYRGRFSVTDLQDCADECLNDVNCKAYNYFLELNSCEVYSTNTPTNDWSQDGLLLFCQLGDLDVTCPIGTQIGTLTTNNDIGGSGYRGRFNVANIQECANECQNDNQCNSYNYFLDLLGCEVYTSAVPTNDWSQDGPLIFCAMPQATTTTTTTTTTSSPSCTGRHRKAWSEDPINRQLYIDGFEELIQNNRIHTISGSHADLFRNGIHWSPEFLPWHRAYLIDLETEIRNLGTKYSCFSLPYWDWSNEPTPTEVINNGETFFIMNSGLGNDGNGGCVNDGSEFSQGNYDPEDPADTGCLLRDVDYIDGGTCLFVQPAELLGDYVETMPDHETFTRQLEREPHYRPHTCISGNMGGFWSPDDPIFWLHHCFVDYLYALWQDCHNYENLAPQSNSNMHNGDVNEVLPMPHSSTTYTVSDVLNIENYELSYERGPFWDNANVNDSPTCGGNMNDEWFKDTRRRLGKRKRKKRRKTKEQKYSDDSYKDLKNKKKNRKELLRAWAHDVCIHVQKESGVECGDKPGNFDDCSDMNINPLTNDIDITLPQLLSKRGLNECQKETRKGYFSFAKKAGALLSLCAGCFDPFCDAPALNAKCNTLNRRDGKLKEYNTKHGLYSGKHMIDAKIIGINDDSMVNNSDIYKILTVILFIYCILITALWLLERRKRKNHKYVGVTNSITVGEDETQELNKI